MTTLADVRREWADARAIPDRVLSALLDKHDGDVTAAAAEWHGAPAELVGPAAGDPVPRPARRRRKGGTP